MVSTGPPPGGTGTIAKKTSWALMVESTLPSSWKKNVLEVVLEKDVIGFFLFLTRSV